MTIWYEPLCVPQCDSTSHLKYPSYTPYMVNSENIFKLIVFGLYLGAGKWNDGHSVYVIWTTSWRWHCKWRWDACNMASKLNWDCFHQGNISNQLCLRNISKMVSSLPGSGRTLRSIFDGCHWHLRTLPHESLFWSILWPIDLMHDDVKRPRGSMGVIVTLISKMAASSASHGGNSKIIVSFDLSESSNKLPKLLLDGPATSEHVSITAI